jgi:hypothetical protein
MRLWVCDNYSRWSFPLQRHTLKWKQKCRFCEWQAQKEISRVQDKKGLDFNPDLDCRAKTAFWMKKGQDAVKMVTANGSSGTAYVCIPCAKLLLRNLQGELMK